jgi:ClpP class serine protease
MKYVNHFSAPGIYALNPQAFGMLMVGPEPRPPLVHTMRGSVAMLHINAALTYDKTPDTINYDELRSAVQCALDDESTTALALVFATPGGDVSGGFDLAADIRRMGAASGKPIIGYTNADCCSMGYALASACSRIIASPTATLGSIGVVAQLLDASKADAAMGLQYAIIGSGARKADRNPHVPMTDEAVAGVQAAVDVMASVFFNLVAEHRGGSPQDYENLQAACFIGAEAKKNNLCDEIMTLGEFHSYLGGMMQSAGSTLQPSAQVNTMSDTDDKKAKRAALAQAAADANAALAAMDKDEEDSAKAEGDDESAKAESDKDEDKATAKAPFQKASDEDKKEDKAVAAKSSFSVDALVATIAGLTATVDGFVKEKAEATRSAILATRPDLSKEAVAAFAAIPTDKLAAVLKAIPKAGISNPKVTHLAEMPFGAAVESMEASLMDVKMGLAKPIHVASMVSGIEQTLGSVKFVKKDAKV